VAWFGFLPVLSSHKMCPKKADGFEDCGVLLMAAILVGWEGRPGVGLNKVPFRGTCTSAEGVKYIPQLEPRYQR